MPCASAACAHTAALVGSLKVQPASGHSKPVKAAEEEQEAHA